MTFSHRLPSAVAWSRASSVLFFLALAVLTSSFSSFAQRSQEQPEPATELTAKTLVTARRHMVVAAHPLAAAAGLEILRAGGSAADAAIATQLVLGLVEPQSSGLGGGAFLLHRRARGRTITSYDGRETAPAASKPDRFPPGVPFDNLIGSGLSIGVPGVPRLLELVHRKHGRLPWAKLFEPAIRLANIGFPVSKRLNALLAEIGPDRFQPAARAYFFTQDGNPRLVRTLLRNPEYAETLRAIADGGADAFYSGRIAEAIVNAARSVTGSPSDLVLEDLATYRALERAPVCFGYRLRRICSMGPPSSGGLALGQILGLLQPYDLRGGPRSAHAGRAIHLMAEAGKLAYADRDRYVADPDQVSIPYGLLEPRYLAERRRLIDPARAMPRPSAGQPPSLGRRAFGADATQELAGTSHLSIVDGEGNAVAMTTTIEAAFGSRVWAAGFLLNNQLTDFSIRPVDKNGVVAANAAGPRKRPRSSMAPAIVVDGRGRLFAVLGSPGGSRIILYAAKALVGMIDWKLDAQEAAELANFGSRGEGLEVERGAETTLPLDALRALGHDVRIGDMTSGLHIITVRNGRLLGGADPRREGVAVGD